MRTLYRYEGSFALGNRRKRLLLQRRLERIIYRSVLKLSLDGMNELLKNYGQNNYFFEALNFQSICVILKDSLTALVVIEKVHFNRPHLISGSHVHSI
jgi:hypothetical protein